MSVRAHGRKIAIIGATGQLGKPTVDALLASGIHTITAIQRSDATSTLPSGIIVQKGDLNDEAFLAETLKGQDALILMPPLSHIVSLQEPAIRAAAVAGVPYILPSEFGPDPFATQLIEENGLLLAKQSIRQLIDKLGVSNWVSIAVGPWLEAGISLGFWGIDTKARKATIWKGAEAKASVAGVAHTAEAIAATLSLPEDELAKFKNSAVYTPSFHLTQTQILDAVQQATGTTTGDWDINTRDVSEVAEEYEAKIKAGDGVAPYTKFFVTHFLEGLGGDFEAKVDKELLNKLELLGMGRENLLDLIKAGL